MASRCSRVLEQSFLKQRRAEQNRQIILKVSAETSGRRSSERGICLHSGSGQMNFVWPLRIKFSKAAFKQSSCGHFYHGHIGELGVGNL